MDPLTTAFKDHARASGADLVGIAGIERFDGLPAQHDPRCIYPEAQSVIVLGRRITRGAPRWLLPAKVEKNGRDLAFALQSL